MASTEVIADRAKGALKKGHAYVNSETSTVIVCTDKGDLEDFAKYLIKLGNLTLPESYVNRLFYPDWFGTDRVAIRKA